MAAENSLVVWGEEDPASDSEVSSSSGSSSIHQKSKGKSSSKHKVAKKTKSKGKRKPSKAGPRKPRKTSCQNLSSKYTTWKKTPVPRSVFVRHVVRKTMSRARRLTHLEGSQF